MEIEDWREKTERETDELAAAFALRHPEYEIDQKQPEATGVRSSPNHFAVRKRANG